jgi:hypothetical protein
LRQPASLPQRFDASSNDLNELRQRLAHPRTMRRRSVLPPPSHKMVFGAAQNDVPTRDRGFSFTGSGRHSSYETASATILTQLAVLHGLAKV